MSITEANKPMQHALFIVAFVVSKKQIHNTWLVEKGGGAQKPAHSINLFVQIWVPQK